MKQQAGNIRRRQEAARLWTARKPEIVKLYQTEGWSQEKLAAHYGVTLRGMQRAMERLGIKSRPRSRSGAENGRYIHGMESTLYRKMVRKDSCARCGKTENLCIHHKDDNHLNNDLKNLEVLCMPCHSSHHKTAWWRMRGGR